MTPSIDRTLHQFLTITDLDLITEFDVLPNCARFPWNICNGCGMPTEDAYSSGHLVLSHFGTCMWSNVETNLSWTCLVSGPLNFEHHSVLLFCFLMNKKKLFMTLELKFHFINIPNWSNFIIIYGFHGLPRYRFDRFNAVHLMRNRDLPVKIFCRKMNTLKFLE